MKKRIEYTSTLRTLFNRNHQYILKGMCLLLIGTSMILTGCNLTDTYNKDAERKGLEATYTNNPNISSYSSNGSEKNTGLATFRRATARYHNLDKAIEEGFEQILPCMEDPEGRGALGVVYAKPDRIDATIDLNEPEILFYEPQKNGELRLVGGEPVIPIELWTENNPPSLFGQKFHRNDEHGLYGLHMWVWKHNPDGVFAFWHPNVSCKYSQ